MIANNNNFDEYVNIAEKQIINKENNPTVRLVLSRLSDGLKYYKGRYEECQKVIAKKNAIPHKRRSRESIEG